MVRCILKGDYQFFHDLHTATVKTCKPSVLYDDLVLFMLDQYREVVLNSPTVLIAETWSSLVIAIPPATSSNVFSICYAIHSPFLSFESPFGVDFPCTGSIAMRLSFTVTNNQLPISHILV